MASQSDVKDSELYRAIMSNDIPKVLNLCTQFSDGPFHRLTIHNDTVLHMALHSGQLELVLTLLGRLSEDDLGKIRTTKNTAGNTLLHEAATNDGLVEAAEKILILNPHSLFEVNEQTGERALFRSVRYGQMKMFKFLDAEVVKRRPNEEDREVLFYQNKEVTILHQAIINGHFELALWIAKMHGDLINTRDAYGMTALQHIARNPLAFKHKVSKCLISSGKIIEERATGNKHEETAIVVDDEGPPNEDGTKEQVEPCCYLPKWEIIQKRVKKYESALELAKLLIARDTSWKKTGSFEDIRQLGNQVTKTDSFEEKKKNIEESLTPLFLATKYGNLEIVKEIFRVYPQAVEHIDEEGGTILHIAIKYGHIEVFDIVEKEMEVPMRRLIKKVDKQSNSILHMVGEKNAVTAEEDQTESPALLLQKNLLLYERIKKICSAHYFNHLNNKGQTAQQVFDDNNKDLRKQGEDWLKNTAQNCSIVAVLIATVAFAAAYTVPGGSKSDTGAPVLLNQTFFVIFAVSDVVSLTFVLMSLIIFLSILTSPFRLKDFENTLPERLLLGVTFFMFSVSMMMLAFSATIILMIRNGEEWKKISLYAVALLPVGVFLVSYMPLYVALSSTLKRKLIKIGGFFPRSRFLCDKKIKGVSGGLVGKG